ncbi:MGMT family protein [Microvirgula aerodenitrificans]|uniref:MGMT family protein n=1 Tax=Microvirgula aerodenitrificans TaxID=57480 RepID=UPI0023EA5566|nr:MGMT family protein [Microvirgula aerodenitrificans]
MAGFPRHARLVGRSLHGPADAVPWFRVINHQGRISPRGLDGNDDYQRILLEDDGVKFDASGRIDLKVYGWHGD